MVYYSFVDEERLINMTLMQKMQQLLTEGKQFKLLVTSLEPQNLKDLFTSENTYHACDIVEIGENYVVISKQGKQLIFPDRRIITIICP